LFDGAGLFVGTAIVLLVFTVLAVILELESPDIVLWTGQRVVGTEQGGVVFYRWHGQNYAVAVPGYGSSKGVSVYLDPANPGDAMTDNAVNRATTALVVGGPFTAAVVLLAVGLSRGYRRKRREMRGVVPPVGYGHGLDPEFVARHLEKLRRDDDKNSG